MLSNAMFCFALICSPCPCEETSDFAQVEAVQKAALNRVWEFTLEADLSPDFDLVTALMNFDERVPVDGKTSRLTVDAVRRLGEQDASGVTRCIESDYFLVFEDPLAELAAVYWRHFPDRDSVQMLDSYLDRFAKQPASYYAFARRYQLVRETVPANDQDPDKLRASIEAHNDFISRYKSQSRLAEKIARNDRFLLYRRLGAEPDWNEFCRIDPGLEPLARPFLYATAYEELLKSPAIEKCLDYIHNYPLAPQLKKVREVLFDLEVKKETEGSEYSAVQAENDSVEQRGAANARVSTLISEGDELVIGAYWGLLELKLNPGLPNKAAVEDFKVEKEAKMSEAFRNRLAESPAWVSVLRSQPEQVGKLCRELAQGSAKYEATEVYRGLATNTYEAGRSKWLALGLAYQLRFEEAAERRHQELIGTINASNEQLCETVMAGFESLDNRIQRQTDVISEKLTEINESLGILHRDLVTIHEDLEKVNERLDGIAQGIEEINDNLVHLTDVTIEGFENTQKELKELGALYVRVARGGVARDPNRVVIVLISGRGQAVKSGLQKLRKKLQEQFSSDQSPLPEGSRVPEGNIYRIGWKRSGDDNPLGEPDTDEIQKKIDVILGDNHQPSYLAVIGYSYGGWAACRVARELERQPDYVALIDPVFGPKNVQREEDTPRGAYVEYWYQRNAVWLGEPVTAELVRHLSLGELSVGAGGIPCIEGIPKNPGISCGFHPVTGAHAAHKAVYRKKWDGSIRTVAARTDAFKIGGKVIIDKQTIGRVQQLISHVTMHEDEHIWRQIHDRIVRDLAEVE